MIEVKGLSKRFGEVQALKGVSFTVNKGQVVGFLGANGAGKTTTMDILCGYLGADEGSARICGFDITDEPEEAKRRLGYLPDEPPLYNDMRVADYVRYAAKLRRVPNAQLRDRVTTTIERLSLSDVAHRIVGNLSKGYRQRVALAQAIVHEPEVLVLDEPTEGLDPNQIVQIRELIRGLKADHTIILSSHILSEVQQSCDEIVIINQGRVVEQGTYAQLIGDTQGKRSFRLHLRQGASALVSEVSAISGVLDVAIGENKSDNVLEFALEGSEEVLDQVLQLALNRNCGIRELVANNKSLEDIFFQMTR